MALRRFRVNINFRGLRAGELVDIDPADWTAAIENGWLTPVRDIVNTRGEGH